jgi:Domain of unknown function (DUF4118)
MMHMSISSAHDTSRLDQLRRALTAVGPAAVVGVAWASTGVRDTMAIANVALVMAVITVAVATISWKAGVTTSIAAALALNYFHTEPVHSLRITAQADLVAVLLLATIGIAVSLATALRVRSFAREHTATVASEHRSLLATASAHDRPVAVVWTEAVQAACAGMSLVDCRIEPLGASKLPTIARQRPHADDNSTFVLPDGGAVVPFVDPRSGAQVALTPRTGMGALELDRRVVFAFIDQLELVLASVVPPPQGTSTAAH